MTSLALLLLGAALTLAQPAPQRIPISTVVGCLTQTTEGTWILTDATEPVAIATKPGSKEAKEPDETAPLGKRRFRIIGTLEEFGVSRHKGHKVRIKGMVLTGSPEPRVNVTSLRHLSPTCK